MNLKKTIAVILSLAMLFVLASCGSNSGTSSSPNSEPAAANTTPATPEPTPVAEPAEEDIDWPTQPISILAGGNPGGDTDFNGRAYTTYLEELLGQPAVIVTTTGGGGSVASQALHDADPDGYTVLVTHLSHSTAYLTGVSPYGFDDFEMVGAIGTSAGDILCVRAGEYETLEDLIAAAKAAPGKITLGVNTGSTTYVEAAAFSKAADITFNYVDAGGASDKAVALLGGHIDVTSLPYGTAKSYLESGEFVGLAVATEKRNSRFSDVPTFAELGYDVVVPTTYCFLMPLGTPKAIVDKFAAACKEICLNNPKYAEDIDKGFGQDPFWLDADDAREFYKNIEAYMAEYIQ